MCTLVLVGERQNSRYTIVTYYLLVNSEINQKLLVVPAKRQIEKMPLSYLEVEFSLISYNAIIILKYFCFTDSNSNTLYKSIDSLRFVCME